MEGGGEWGVVGRAVSWGWRLTSWAWRDSAGSLGMMSEEERKMQRIEDIKELLG